MDEPPIEIVAGRYRLLSLMGKGGMGSVWRAEHVTLGTPVAVKLLSEGLAERADLRARFIREAQAAAALRHPNVVRILDQGEEGRHPFIVMEYLEGESLGQKLRRQGTLSVEETAHVMEGVCRAIAKAHRGGIVHRDLKPDNVFLVEEEDGSRPVKVLDFGIAKVLAVAEIDTPEASTATGTALGTPAYMSPEQVRGKKNVDHRTDLWALGVIAFECLTGVRPFQGDSVGDLVFKICLEPVPLASASATVPSGFDEWFLHATRRPPEERFQSAEDLARALAHVLTPGRSWVDDEKGRSSQLPAAVVPVDVVDPKQTTAHAATHSMGPKPGRTARVGLFAGAAVLAVGLASTVLHFGASGRETPSSLASSPTNAAAPSGAGVAAPSAIEGASAASSNAPSPGSASSTAPSASGSSTAAASPGALASSSASSSSSAPIAPPTRVGAEPGRAGGIASPPPRGSTPVTSSTARPAPSVNLGI